MLVIWSFWIIYMYVNLLAKLLFKIQTVRDFVKIISIPDEELFSETTVGCMTSYFVKLYDGSRWFCNPNHPHFRQCISLFAVAEGWLLLDMGWFVFSCHTYYVFQSYFVYIFDLKLNQIFCTRIFHILLYCSIWDLPLQLIPFLNSCTKYKYLKHVLYHRKRWFVIGIVNARVTDPSRHQRPCRGRHFPCHLQCCSVQLLQLIFPANGSEFVSVAIVLYKQQNSYQCDCSYSNWQS